MSYYTLSLKDYYNSFGTGKTWEEKALTATEKLFDFNFPWYTEKSDISLADFKRMFFEHHFTDEIGYETIALFKMKMQEVFYRKIPYYTDMYKALHIEYDPLINHEMRGTNNGTTTGEETQNGTTTNSGSDKHNTEHTGTIVNDGNTSNTNSNTHSDTTTTNSTTTSSDTSKTQNIHSDFPQANFSTAKDYASNMDRGQNATDNTTTVKGTNNNDGNSKDVSNGAIKNTETFANNDLTTDTFGHIINNESSGNSKGTSSTSYSDIGWSGGSKTTELELYRKAIRNLNEMLLHEFDDLFMGVLEPLENNLWCSGIYGI